MSFPFNSLIRSNGAQACIKASEPNRGKISPAAEESGPELWSDSILSSLFFFHMLSNAMHSITWFRRLFFLRVLSNMHGALYYS